MSSASQPSHAASSPTRPLVERLLALWQEPFPSVEEAEVAFAGLYSDPLTLNGTAMPRSALVSRAAAMHHTLQRTGAEVLEIVEAPGRLVLAFTMTARQIGTLPSAIGDVAPTGRTATVRTIDILTLTDGLISDIWVVSDELGMLAQLGVRLPALVP